MALTTRQLAKAARLYGLAVLSNQDAGGAESDDETQVMQRAIYSAGAALRRLGFEPTELATITQCIDAAISMNRKENTMATSPQFHFGTPIYLLQSSRQVDNQASSKRVGIKSVPTSCNCGHAWTAHVGQGLFTVVGGVRVTCPACAASEDVPGRQLGL